MTMSFDLGIIPSRGRASIFSFEYAYLLYHPFSPAFIPSMYHDSICEAEAWESSNQGPLKTFTTSPHLHASAFIACRRALNHLTAASAFAWRVCDVQNGSRSK